ncbi:hypothetical protein H633G_11728 [Metarhizium anisopliae BRIP 53284]|nr:hypothetical protein H633G_11728 [Metarhizium anisopliae BRIP 53284]
MTTSASQNGCGAFALSICVSYTTPSIWSGGGRKAPGDLSQRTALYTAALSEKPSIKLRQY